MTLARPISVITLTAALLLPLGPRAQAAPAAPAAQAAIQSAYAQINAAFARHDLDTFMTFFTPDYKVVDENGKTFTKEQTRKQYEGQLKQMKTMQSRYTLSGFQTVPGGVEAEMKLHSQGAGEKRVAFMKFKGHYTDDLWVHDLWTETPQGWRIKSRKTLSDKLVTGPG